MVELDLFELSLTFRIYHYAELNDPSSAAHGGAGSVELKFDVSHLPLAELNDPWSAVPWWSWICLN